MICLDFKGEYETNTDINNKNVRTIVAKHKEEIEKIKNNYKVLESDYKDNNVKLEKIKEQFEELKIKNDGIITELESKKQMIEILQNENNLLKNNVEMLKLDKLKKMQNREMVSNEIESTDLIDSSDESPKTLKIVIKYQKMNIEQLMNE